MARQLVSFGTEGTVFGREGAARSAPQPAMPAAMAVALVAFEGIRKSGQGATPALSWLELGVGRGEVATLLGPAGAGKSVAIDIAAGFIQPDAGQVLMKGERVARLPPWRRDIGLVSTQPDLFPDMTVLGNVTFPLEARGTARAEGEERALAMLARWGIPASLGAARPAALPPGQQLRVALARALVHAPSLLLLDDPLRALEAEDRDTLAADLLRLRAELGLTVLHATRDAALALALSDRVAVLEAGRMRQWGTPRDLYDSPADPVVAALTGPCNRLSGTVVSIEDGACHVRLDCGLGAVGLPVIGAEGSPQAGGRCTLLIRPERVAVAPLSPAELGGDAVPARLLEARFAGDHLRLRLLIGQGGELLVHRPIGLPLPEAGGEASIAWDLSAARVHAGG